MDEALVVDDHPIVRRGLVEILTGLSFGVHEAATAMDALALLADHPVSLVVSDLSLPDLNGFELLAEARRRHRAQTWILLSVHDDRHYRARARELGAAAYIAKTVDNDVLASSIEQVLRGGPFLGVPELAASDDRIPPSVWNGLSELTPSERRVMALLAQNKTSRNIAETLHISVRTVQNHRHNICQKLELRGNNRLLEVAVALRPFLDS